MTFKHDTSFLNPLFEFKQLENVTILTNCLRRCYEDILLMCTVCGS